MWALVEIFVLYLGSCLLTTFFPESRLSWAKSRPSSPHLWIPLHVTIVIYPRYDPLSLRLDDNVCNWRQQLLVCGPRKLCTGTFRLLDSSLWCTQPLSLNMSVGLSCLTDFELFGGVSNKPPPPYLPFGGIKNIKPSHVLEQDLGMHDFRHPTDLGNLPQNDRDSLTL